MSGEARGETKQRGGGSDGGSGEGAGGRETKQRRVREPPSPRLAAVAVLTKRMYIGLGKILSYRSGGNGGGGGGGGGEVDPVAVERAAIDETTGLLVPYTEQPLEDIRCGAYAVFAAVAEQCTGWGLRALYSHAPFRHVALRGPGADPSKRGKECLFAVVEVRQGDVNNECSMLCCCVTRIVTRMVSVW